MNGSMLPTLTVNQNEYQMRKPVMGLWRVIMTLEEARPNLSTEKLIAAHCEALAMAYHLPADVIADYMQPDEILAACYEVYSYVANLIVSKLSVIHTAKGKDTEKKERQTPKETVILWYSALMEVYGWTLQEVDVTELEFILDMSVVNWKADKHNKNWTGNADDLAFLWKG